MNLRFWQSNNLDTPPPYFVTQEQHRSSRAWVLAISTFIITLIGLFLIFMGGRWVYHKAYKTKNDTPTTTAVTDNNATQNPADTVTPTPTTTPTPTPTVKPTPVSTGSVNDGTTSGNTSKLPSTGMDTSLPLSQQ